MSLVLSACQAGFGWGGFVRPPMLRKRGGKPTRRLWQDTTNSARVADGGRQDRPPGGRQGVGVRANARIMLPLSATSKRGR